MTPQMEGCVQPARGPIDGAEGNGTAATTTMKPPMAARVGCSAPDFEATAYLAGKGFAPVKLSDYKGRWIVLCFYPGDFTFV